MSNERYDWGSERFLSGQLNWLSQTFRIVLIDTNSYSFLKGVHRSLVDIPLVARVAVSPPLAGMTATAGVARASDVNMGPVFGLAVKAMVIYHDTGTENTSELIAYLDNAHGLPFLPQGETVHIHLDVGPNGIFKL